MKRKKEIITVEKDVLTQKQQELAAYTEQANTAVSLVTSTIDNLSRINDAISEKIQEIEAYQSELTRTRDGLTGARDKNSRIISNFRALLEG